MAKQADVRFSEDKEVRVLYTVSFTWCDDYRPKTAGIKSLSLVVEGSDKFEALSNAWDIAKSLDAGEPRDMNVKRIEVCD